MSSDTSATGEMPALEPPADPAGRHASGFAARAPDPPHDLVTSDPAGDAPDGRAPGHRGRALTVAAAAGIGIAILIMVAASLVRGSWMLPPVVMPAVGPPWEIPIRHVSADLVTYGLWLAAPLGAGGVAGGPAALHPRGRARGRAPV